MNRPRRRPISASSNKRRSKARKDRLKRWSQFAIAPNASAETNPARAAAARNIRTAACAKTREPVRELLHNYDFRRRPGFGNGIPTMAYLLNFIYGLVLLIATPWLVFQSLFRGKY